MAKILIVSIGGLDTLQPYLAAGSELANRGHDVAIATSSHLRDWVIFAGLRFVKVAPDFESYGGAQKALSSRQDPQSWLRQVILASLPEMLYDLNQDVEWCDALITNSDALGIGQWGQALGKFWISSSHDPVEFQSRFEPSAPLFSNPQLSSTPWVKFVSGGDRGVQQRAADQLSSQIRSAIWSATSLTLPEHLLSENRFSKHLHLGLFSPMIAEGASDWPKPVQLTGFLPYGPTRVDAGTLEWLDEGAPPLVFVASEPDIDFVMSSVSLARRSGRRGLIMAGFGADPYLSLSDANTRITEVGPLDQIFRRSCGAVILGGHSAATALSAGVSCVSTPRTAAEADTMRRFEELDLISSYQGDFGSMDHFETMMEWLEDEQYAQYAKSCAGTVNPEFGVRLFANAVESALASATELGGQSFNDSGNMKSWEQSTQLYQDRAA